MSLFRLSSTDKTSNLPHIYIIHWILKYITSHPSRYPHFCYHQFVDILLLNCSTLSSLEHGKSYSHPIQFPFSLACTRLSHNISKANPKHPTFQREREREREEKKKTTAHSKEKIGREYFRTLCKGFLQDLPNLLKSSACFRSLDY